MRDALDVLVENGRGASFHLRVEDAPPECTGLHCRPPFACLLQALIQLLQRVLNTQCPCANPCVSAFITAKFRPPPPPPPQNSQNRFSVPFLREEEALLHMWGGCSSFPLKTLRKTVKTAQKQKRQIWQISGCGGRGPILALISSQITGPCFHHSRDQGLSLRGCPCRASR